MVKSIHTGEWLPDIQDLGAYDDKTFPRGIPFKDVWRKKPWHATYTRILTIDKTTCPEGERSARNSQLRKKDPEGMPVTGTKKGVY